MATKQKCLDMNSKLKVVHFWEESSSSKNEIGKQPVLISSTVFTILKNKDKIQSLFWVMEDQWNWRQMLHTEMKIWNHAYWMVLSGKINSQDWGTFKYVKSVLTISMLEMVTVCMHNVWVSSESAHNIQHTQNNLYDFNFFVHCRCIANSGQNFWF
jgi:hypothetical protein